MQRFVLWSFALAGSTIASAGLITIGNPPDPAAGNAFPFSAAYNTEYQQIYASSDFSGIQTFSGLEFFDTQFNPGAGASLPTGTYTIRLSTTSATVASPNLTFAANIGADVLTVFSGSIAQPFALGNTLIINFSTPFAYNPANGNLLLDVVGSGLISSSIVGFDFRSDATGVFNRVYCGGAIACTTGQKDSLASGLVTGFITSTAPEPGTILLAALGLGTIALRRRR